MGLSSVRVDQQDGLKKVQWVFDGWSRGSLDIPNFIFAKISNELYVSDIFDFVLAFAGVSTLQMLVLPAIVRFIENVYVYDMKLWDALQESFGEDKHALNSAPIMLSFADIALDNNQQPHRVTETRLLAYSNLKDGRPWGLDIYRCGGCEGPAYNMIFHPDGKQYYGSQWIRGKIKYQCMSCDYIRRNIPCPSWIHAAGNQNFGRVWYNWPLTHAQLTDIGHK